MHMLKFCLLLCSLVLSSVFFVCFETRGCKNTLFKLRHIFTIDMSTHLKLRKKLLKCYIWSIALYGAETWTLRTADQKYLESFEMWCWRRMEKIIWTDHVRNE